MDVVLVALGYRYGKSLVPISEDDEAAMKFEAARCLSLMGFTKEKNIKQHQLVGTSVQVVVASEEVRVQNWVWLLIVKLVCS